MVYRRKFYRHYRRGPVGRSMVRRWKNGKRHKFVQRTSFALAQKWVDHGQTLATRGADVSFSSSRIDPGTWGHLTGVASGSGISTRNGRGVILKSLQIEGLLYCARQVHADNTSGLLPKYVTLAIVLDKKTNGVATEGNSIWTNLTALDNFKVARRDLTRARNYHVLWQRTFTLGGHREQVGATSYVTYYNQKRVKINLKMNLPQTYIDGDADVASVADNSLHLYMWTDYSAGVGTGYLSPDAVFEYALRFRFLDNC